MSQFATALHIARADFRERVRRYSFLGTLGFAVYLAILAGRGGIFIQLGNWRGRYSSAWMGMLLSMICTTFISLAGFYMVSNSVKRDEQTRVGQILAAAPISRAAYTLGKVLSNFAVLASMVGVLMLSAIPLQLLKGEDGHIDLLQLILPFVAFALPMMALVAGIAVLFEVTPLLRSSLGSAAFFFLWTAGIIASEDLDNLELFGIATYLREIGGVVRSLDASYVKDFSINFPIGNRPPLQLFTWTPADFAASLWGGRAVILLMSLFGGELRLLVARRHWVVYLLALGLLIATFTAPLKDARRGVLCAIWIMPMFAFSRLGARDDVYSTRSLVYTGPNAASRQLFSSFTAAALLPLVLSAGVLVRLALAGDLRGVAALVAGATFVSGLAHTLGELTRSPKAFEGVYILWWYIGPVNAGPWVDFYGVTADTARPLMYALFSVVLLMAAWIARQMRTRLA